MIIREEITIKDKQFIKTYSDKGMYIERDGVQYSEAIDPIGTNREYIETDIPIEHTEITQEEKEVLEKEWEEEMETEVGE